MPYNLSIPGWMPEYELKTLEDLARTIPKNGKMVEIGSFIGRSSWCWAKTVDPSVKVYCLDIWSPPEHPFYPPSVIKGQEDNPETSAEFGYAESVDQLQGTYENFERNVADCPNIIAMKGASPFDFQAWEEKVDLVFLDGVHHNPIFWADLNFWYYKIKPGGVFCGDDCARTHPDVVWGVQDFAKNLGLPYIVQGRIWMIPVPPFRNITSAIFEKKA